MRHSSPETKRFYQLGLAQQVREHLEQLNEKTYEAGTLLRLDESSREQSTQQIVPVLEPQKAKSSRKPLRFRDSAVAEEKTQEIKREGESGAPGGNRTPDPLLRRQTLYPTELRARSDYFL